MSGKPFSVGIVGCGLVGQKRASALGKGGRLAACADIDINRAQSLAAISNASAFEDSESLLKLPEIDIVVVATLHDSLATITQAAVEAGKHVLVEKPAARSTGELIPVIQASERGGVKVHVGFNHRYHRSVCKARELIESGVLGELMLIRGRYGHGGRVDYNREWRAQPEISGGGELIDQGPHLIDLSRWFLGDFSEIQGFAHAYYWDMPVDDNGFLLLKTPEKKTAFLHVSCTEWKNLFSMEIFGRNGKLDLNGLGGSYGLEKITWYKLLPEMGPPETVSWEYPMGDNSWAVEMAEFYEDIRLDRESGAGLKDANAVLSIIETIYKESGYDYRS